MHYLHHFLGIVNAVPQYVLQVVVRQLLALFFTDHLVETATKNLPHRLGYHKHEVDVIFIFYCRPFARY